MLCATNTFIDHVERAVSSMQKYTVEGILNFRKTGQDGEYL